MVYTEMAIMNRRRSIRDFIDAEAHKHQGRYQKMSETEGPNYRAILDKAGYYSVLLNASGHTQWKEVHKWCNEHIGHDNYTWTGSRFWFDTEKDAMLFTLKWS